MGDSGGFLHIIADVLTTIVQTAIVINQQYGRGMCLIIKSRTPDIGNVQHRIGVFSLVHHQIQPIRSNWNIWNVIDSDRCGVIVIGGNGLVSRGNRQ